MVVGRGTKLSETTVLTLMNVQLQAYVQQMLYVTIYKETILASVKLDFLEASAVISMSVLSTLMTAMKMLNVRIATEAMIALVGRDTTEMEDHVTKDLVTIGLVRQIKSVRDRQLSTATVSQAL